MKADVAARWDPADYAVSAAFVPALGAPVVALLAPRPGEHILDVGCGDGVLTEALVAAGARVVGVDASADMAAAAVAKGLDVRVVDAQALPFEQAFDAAFSNAALHWMPDPAAVAAGVFRALKPGGRFVGETGGDGNVAAIRAELTARGHVVHARDTHWYPTVAAFAAVYAAAGFVAIEAELIDRPTPLPAGIAGWVRTFRQGLFDVAAIPKPEQAAIEQGVARRLAATLRRPDGVDVADYVRLRFAMRKPA